MDPEKNDIDPTWWVTAFDNANVEQYEPAELLSTRLAQLAKQEGIGEFQKMALEVLTLATSALLKPADWLEPFSPAIDFGNRRSVIPADLTTEQIALLARIAPLLDRPDLRARVADVAWVYGDRSNVAMLDLAIHAYRAAPLTSDVWFSIGRDAWQRAFELAKRQGADGVVRIQEMTKALKDEVLAGTLADRFRVPDCAALLREQGQVARVERGEVAVHLTTLAAAAKGIDPRLSRHLEREAAAWLGDDADAVNAATDRVARTYIAEADDRAADPAGGAMAEGHFVEKAIATFRTLPRSYRLANGIEGLIVQLRDRLHASRETTLENMMRITSGPIDLTDMVSYAQEQVSGHADRFEALAMFATLVPPMDAERVRGAAEKAVDGSLSHIFGSATFSRDARKVAASEGSTRQPGDPAVENEIVRHITFQAQVLAQGLIRPALELLTFQHRYDRDYLTALCGESPTVPEGHAGLWGAGLTFGLAGDYGPAVAILVPQLEQVVRILLKRRGVHTLYVDEQTGVESEKSLKSLLEVAEAVDIFGAGIVMELRALLVVQGGFNLRNDTAHGLLDDANAWSYHAMYVWWFCLRLVLLPVIQTANAASRQQDAAEEAEDGKGDKADEQVPDSGSDST